MTTNKGMREHIEIEANCKGIMRFRIAWEREWISQKIMVNIPRLLSTCC